MVHITDKDKYKYINKFCKSTYYDVTGYNDDDNSSFVKTFPYGILKAYFSNILDNNHISDAVEGLGSNDFGIDAFFVDTDNKKIIFCQFKSTEESTDKKPIREWLSDFHSVDNRIKESINNKKTHKNHRVNTIIEEYSYYIQDSTYEVELYFFHSSTYTEDVDYPNIKYENINDIYQQIKHHESNEADTSPVECIINLEKPENTDHSTKNGLYYFTPKAKHDTCIGIISGKTIFDLYHEHQNNLFDRNVRFFLEGSSINKNMIKTAKANPTDFYYYNNGVTIACEDFEKIGDFKLKLKLPQVINGAQTFGAIYEAYKKESEKKDLEDIKVLAIIIKTTKADDTNFQTNLTTYRNSNNKINFSDYKGNDTKQEALQRKFYKLNWFYEIKRGEIKKYIKNRHLKVEAEKQQKHLNIKNYEYKDRFNTYNLTMENLVQPWCAYFSSPVIAKGSKQSIFKNEEVYNEIFGQNTLEITDAKAKLMLFVYLLSERLNYLKKITKRLLNNKNLSEDEIKYMEDTYNVFYRNKINEKSDENDANFMKYYDYLTYGHFHIIAFIGRIIKDKNLEDTIIKDYESTAILNQMHKWVYCIMKYLIDKSYMKHKSTTSFVNYSKKNSAWVDMQTEYKHMDNEDKERFTLK